MKKLVWLFAGFALSLSVAILGWPTVAVDTTDLDAATDSRSAARVDLLDAVQKLNVMIADRNVANGVAALTSTGGITVPKTCVAGYARHAVNYCHIATSPVETSLVRDVCTAIAVPAGSAAVALNLGYYASAQSANAVANRSAQVFSYGVINCGGASYARAQAAGREFTAVTATSLGSNSNDAITTVISGNAYVQLIDDTGNLGLGTVGVWGYYD